MFKWIASFFRPIIHRQSYIHLLYLLVTFLLGTIYLCFLMAGFALSFATMFIWIGLPLTLFMLLTLQTLATFERSMLRTWLKQEIIPPPPVKSEGGVLKQLRVFLKSATTWKNLTYVLAKSLPGLLISVFVISMFGAALNLFAGTIASLIDKGMHFLFYVQPFSDNSLAHVTISIIVPLGTPFAGMSELSTPLLCVRLGSTTLSGLLLFTSALHLSNGVALLWGRFASLLLSASREDIQLAEAKQLAEQARARAEQADQKRRELITNVSHELRTPVASIQGHVEVLLKACGDDATTLPAPDILRHYLAIVQRESQRLGALVDDLLALARAETDELYLKLEAVTAGEVVEEAYRALMALARRERQITLIQKIEPDLPPILADRQRLTQVLLNLIRNAIAYTPEGGIVSISLHKADEQHLALLVSDTGIGISSGDQERIFERFYRADASRSHRSGGAGLGLAIVSEFVRAMGGSISVESTIGEGSTFRVLLQIVQASRA